MKLIATVGLEVHAQLRTRTKLFCRCLNAFGAQANTHTCPVCLALPGALPLLNREAVVFAVRTGLALNCTVQLLSVFARKNYFYPDLPKGYQISQFDSPLCIEGFLHIDDVEEPGKSTRVGIKRVHLEEDAGKLLHGDNVITKEGSLIDLNRAGVPLVEIVGDPDLKTGAEAAAYLKSLRSILRYLGVCDGNMEEGSFRCDANVSVRPADRAELGTKVEVKNMNSFKHVHRAIDHEIERQMQAVGSGRALLQETRLWNPDKGVTSPMRSKEESHDYRYFPEPDLRPLKVAPQMVDEIRLGLPALPGERRAAFEREYGLPAYDADVLTQEKETADFFDANVAALSNPTPADIKKLSNLVMSEVLRIANEKGTTANWVFRRKETPADVLKMMNEGKVSGKMAKDVLDEAAASGSTADEIVLDRGLAQISDSERLLAVVREVLAAHPGQLSQYRAGKDKLLGFFVGQVMKSTAGKANPALVNDLLKEEIGRDV